MRVPVLFPARTCTSWLGPRIDRRYRRKMEAQPVMTAEELFERMREAEPPSVDDVPVTFDGQRLDSPEAVKAWLLDLAARRSAVRADDDG
jgi:hypothetical protein